MNEMNLEHQDKSRYVSVSTEPVEDIRSVPSYVKELIECGADMIHCDVMDGIAVKKMTYNYSMLNKLTKNFKNYPFDVHLMIDDAYSEIDQYIKCKPWAITVQYDYFTSERQFIKTLKKIQKANIIAGVALSPNIPVSYIIPYLPYIDLVLIMGVVPGLGGQKLIEPTLLKIGETKELRDKFRREMLISFDGGVTFENVDKIFEAGADIVVSGSVVYNCFSRRYAISSLKKGEPMVK